jgi:hypothetical protein
MQIRWLLLVTLKTRTTDCHAATLCRAPGNISSIPATYTSHHKQSESRNWVLTRSPPLHYRSHLMEAMHNLQSPQGHQLCTWVGINTYARIHRHSNSATPPHTHIYIYIYIYIYILFSNILSSCTLCNESNFNYSNKKGSNYFLLRLWSSGIWRHAAW